MIDGLEIKECKFSEVLQSTNYFRLEADFFTAENLQGDNIVLAEKYLTRVQYGTSEFLNEEKKGYPILRLNEFESYFIKEPAKYCNIISQQQYEDLKLHKGDVLICRTNGNPDFVGRAAVIMEDFDYAFASYLFRVNVSDEITPEYFVAYLQSKYGRIEIDKNSMKGNQTNFSPAKLKDIKIPCFSHDFCLKITDKFNRAYDFQQCSKADYKLAEKILEESLCIKQISNDIVSIKSLSESFNISGRLDAEYYQPKYEQIENQIASNSTVYNSCKIYDKNFNPNDDIIYQYIELANVDLMGGIATPSSIIGKELPSRARRLVKTGQIIISSIEGSLQSCALITEQFNNAICSTGFFVLDSEKYNPETLLVLFKSEPIQELLKKRCSGTILTAISKDELEKTPLPELDKGIQDQIAEKVQESFRLRKKSKELLDIAVKAVEMAIETDEETAIAWLKEQGV
ncbi:MAG: hypothetical protein J6B11_08760 [Spirochaetales bacterium]|nr:hypothetical protein [Spirochaetales bacterium]